jgi:putative redox protein
MRHLDSRREELERRGEAEISIGGRSFRITRQLLDDIRRTEMTPAIRDLGRALLVLHSPDDEVVSIDHATEIFTTARHPKSFVSLDSADHLLSNRDDGFWVGRLISTWAWRYLEDGSITTGPEPQSTEVREPG